MRLSTASAVVLCVALAATASAQQALVCPAPTATSKSCELFHYHVLAYRPDTRQFMELSAVNQFASQSACERARDGQIRRNLAVVDYFKRVRNQQQYEPDRFGPCHCDMTVDKTSAVFTTDAQRLLQVRTAEEVRLRVRERLLDQDLTSDNELVRGLIAPPVSLPQLGGPKLVPLPTAPATPTVTNSPDDLKATRPVGTSLPAIASLDLPLIEPLSGEVVPAAASPQPVSVASAPAALQQPASTGEPATSSSTASAEPLPPAQTAADAASAADAADSFIEYETQRIQTVLKASAAISDETVKSKIFESCMQRIQLLSNLRSLIEGSGSRSRLAAAAQAARSESERLSFVTRLFGDPIAQLWAPKDATDVILKPNAAIDAEPERVLRDNSGRFAASQKKRALYVMLARSQPTEDQQLWLVTVMDGFLR